MKKAQGFVYDITNFAVRNKALHDAYRAKEEQRLKGLSTRWARERDIVQESDELARRQEARSTQRVSSRRYEVRVLLARCLRRGSDSPAPCAG